MKVYLKVILINLFPSVLIFLGRNTYVFNYFKEINFLWFDDSTDIAYVQAYFFFIGIVWVGLISPIQYAYIRKRFDKQSEVFSELIGYNKKILFKHPQTKFKSLDKKFNTRIFVPERNLWNLFKKGTVLVPKEFNGLTDKLEHKKLKFMVDENSAQGMVGKSYSKLEIFIDFDMSDQNQYNLTENQKRHLREVKFCSAIPLLNNKNEAIAVLAVDSEKKIRRTVNIENTWRNHLIDYAAFVSKNIKI